MKKRFLVTTADERTWPKDSPLLFLGAWCKIYDRNNLWKDLDATMVPYHWDDRKKLYADYLYLQGLKEELLQELTQKLNEIHKTDHSLRYWRILIGPWLMYFSEILYDRWEMIRKAQAEFSISGVKLLDISSGKTTTNDMGQFSQAITEDSWNEAIYSEILRNWTSIPFILVPKGEPTGNSDKKSWLTFSRWLKHKLIHLGSSTTHLFVKKDEAFFISSYLPVNEDIRLQLRLKQIPRLWEFIPPPKAEVNDTKRGWVLGKPDKEGFSTMIRQMIPGHIPTIYIEGYQELIRICNKQRWPEKPKLIFTSNSFFHDDVFKAWAAEKVENGSPLIIGQHGGNYGTCPIAPLEEHEYAICDFWLSWGWSDICRPKIRPAFNLKMVEKKIPWKKDGAALIVGMLIPRYSYRMMNFHIAGQWLDYFEDQCRFVNSLSADIRSKIIIRLSYQDYSWKQKKRWNDRCPDIFIDEGKTPISKLIRDSRIYISTYNATTFLESMVMNFPTLMFWDQKYYEISDDVRPYFDRLITVGIFHTSPESAAQKLTSIWEDPGKWWNSKEVQDIREEFCGKFSRMPENPIDELVNIFSQITDTNLS